MNTTAQQTAAAANRAVYNAGWTEAFVEGAPHLKHAALRVKFDTLLAQVLELASAHTSPPRVLDMGAGEGSVTRRLLERGAIVTAVDVSESQLAELARKCAVWSQQLTVRPGEVGTVLSLLDGPYDLVVASAFLHHVPDYLDLVGRAVDLLSPHGQFLSFQDPMRYDTVNRFTRLFGETAYLSWRVFQGDVWGGCRRRLHRTLGRLDDSALDQAEYHVLRNGVDQDALAAVLRAAGFECEVFRYFSTQSRVFQPLGSALHLTNTFGVVARR